MIHLQTTNSTLTNLQPPHPQTTAKMASSLARLAAQAHSIHITTTPMPRNLSESKLVLSALQRFGEVVTFRNLKVPLPHPSHQEPV
jgi:hypothetical protein